MAKLEELGESIRNKVWYLVDRPSHQKVIDTKWVFKNKQDENAVVTRNKARLIAKEYAQCEGISFDETLAPISRIEAIILLLAYMAYHNFTVYQMDVENAFLNANYVKRSMWNSLSALKKESKSTGLGKLCTNLNKHPKFRMKHCLRFCWRMDPEMEDR